MKTHWKKLTNPNYLGAYSLDDGEKERVIKIKSVSKEFVKSAGGRESECIVAQIHNSKPLILNKTNCKVLEKIYATPYIEEWADKDIIIYIALVSFAGEKVEALRIKPKKPSKPELTPEKSKDWGKVLNALKGGFTIPQIEGRWKISNANKDLLNEQV